MYLDMVYLEAAVEHKCKINYYYGMRLKVNVCNVVTTLFNFTALMSFNKVINHENLKSFSVSVS